MKYYVFLLLTVYQSLVFAQGSQNVSLFGQLDPEPIHYAGSWSYANGQGAEFALLGAYNGTSIISIDDSLNIYEADWVPGPASNWREITVIGDHAFVVTEGNAGDIGMQVIFLGDLPDSVAQVTTFDSTFERAHMIEKDILGDPNYVYVCGTNPGTGGVHIIDVSDPANPQEVSQYAPTYAHDCHVRGDTMYVAAIYDTWIDVVDISDKANPTRITQIIYPGTFTHSSWTTADNSYLMVCDEKDSLPARVFDIRNLSNISEVATWTANPVSLVHNAYIRGDFAFVSHNTEGLRVVDLCKPDVPVEVGHYDTWSGSSGGFHGLWSACPFFPSGKIIGGNRENGLYVWRFNDTYAGRIYGQVVDSVTQLPIVGADIRILQTDDATTSLTGGSYKFGALPSGASAYTVQYSRPGYYSKTISTALQPKDSLWFRVELAPEAVAIGETDVSEPEITVMAGPGSGDLQVDVPSSLTAEPLKLSLYATDGRLLQVWTGLKPGRSHFQVPNHPAGPVIYELNEGGKRRKTGRIMWLD